MEFHKYQYLGAFLMRFLSRSAQYHYLSFLTTFVESIFRNTKFPYNNFRLSFSTYYQEKGPIMNIDLFELLTQIDF